MIQLRSWDPWKPVKELICQLRVFTEVHAQYKRFILPAIAGLDCCIAGMQELQGFMRWKWPMFCHLLAAFL